MEELTSFDREFTYTPSQAFNIEEAKVKIFISLGKAYYTQANDALNTAMNIIAQAKLTGHRVQYIQDTFLKLNGSNSHHNNAPYCSDPLHTSELKFLHCPMWLEITGSLGFHFYKKTL